MCKRSLTAPTSYKRKTTVGFALTVLQRRLASSPEAIYQSLRRRRKRLESRLAEERRGKSADSFDHLTEDYDEDFPSGESEKSVLKRYKWQMSKRDIIIPLFLDGTEEIIKNIDPHRNRLGPPSPPVL